MAAAKISETQAKAGLHQASGFAHALNALGYAHSVHADNMAAGLEKGIDSVQQPQQAPPDDPNLEVGSQTAPQQGQPPLPQ